MTRPGAPNWRPLEALLGTASPSPTTPTRRLDHGAYVPLTVMYPDATIPVLQISMPTLEPERLLHLGEQLRPLRDEGVLVIGLDPPRTVCRSSPTPTPEAAAPGWSKEFDGWAAERFAAGDLDALVDFRAKAPGMPYAHPTIEHFSPLFVALGPLAIRTIPAAGHRRVLDGSGKRSRHS